MYLKRLEIHGFKSFANKTVLEFEKGVTSVVGPNGSGKSNIADAIRWVLGEQSLKQLRGKKSEDVIFAGSEKKTRLSFAEVSVTFDNADRKIPIDYGEVSITRRMDRSGESDYMINGNKVRLLDVVDLVLKSNIGTSRYTVIGQGTIDQMILSGPGAVKELIDEASGVKTYYIRRDKSLKRMEQTAQNLIRVQDLLTEIEPRLKSLRRQAKKMQDRAVIEQELKIYQAEFYSQKYWQAEEVLRDFNFRITALVEKRHALEKDIHAHRTNLESHEQSNRSEISEYSKIQNEIKKLQEQKNHLMEDIAVIRGKLQAEKGVGKGDAKSLELEKTQLENSKKALEENLKNSAGRAQKIHADLEQKRKMFAEIERKLSDLQKQMDNPQQIDFEQLNTDLGELESNFNEFYQHLANSENMPEAIGHADKFRSSLGEFKRKAVKFTQNPYENFEKQRKLLQDALMAKDQIGQELNSLDLENSKISIDQDYAQKELRKIDQKLLQVNLELQSAQSQSIDEYFKGLVGDEQRLNAEMGKIAGEISRLDNSLSEYHAKEQGRKKEVFEEERAYRNKQDELSKIKDQESELQIQKAKVDTQKENVVAEAQGALGLEKLSEIRKEPIPSTANNLEEKILKLKSQLDVIGGIDELTLKEYEETEQRYTYLSTQVKDLDKAMHDLKDVIEQLDAHIKKQFQDAFARVDDKFQNYFRILFNGGRAYLGELKAAKEKSEEKEDQSEEGGEGNQEAKLRPEEKMLAKYQQGGDDIVGIDIKATPPGKKLAAISALSGGERALTSIALLCSLLSCFPSPFVVLDEVDAALDEANTIRFAQILGTLASQTQFITVTHNRETMRQAHTLYGVTMGDDSVSKILSIKLEQAQAFAK